MTFKVYSHQSAAEKKHKHKIGRSSAERPLLEHSTVSVREDHVEEKVETNGSKEHEICHQSPHLKQTQTTEKYTQLNSIQSK